MLTKARISVTDCWAVATLALDQAESLATDVIVTVLLAREYVVLKLMISGP
jgi:hypothetical protein